MNFDSQNESILMRIIFTIFPFGRWFKNYSFDFLKSDLISGITVALVLIPQSMAYAQLANLPAYYGLYASFLPPIVASLFGSSRQLATGPVAIVSLMTATALAPLATDGSAAFIAYAVLLALIVGLFQLLLGILRLGLIVNFLSHPVVNGFTNAAAIIIASSQLSKLFGVNVIKYEHTYETVYHIFIEAFSSTHLPTLGLAILAFAIMFGIKKINPRIPYVLFAVVITTMISWFSGYEQKQSVSIDKINCAKTVKLLQEYNRKFFELDSLCLRRVTCNNRITEFSKTNSEQTKFYIQEHQNNINVLNHRIDLMNEKLHKLQYDIMQMDFKINKSNKDSISFCPAGFLPDSINFNDENWKIKIRYAKLDLEHILFSGGGDIVGTIPSGLPPFKIPEINLQIILQLLPMAMIITLLGFMEAISIAKAMAAKTKQQLDPNQELVGQGLANICGSFFSSYPVSGSFSRSAVNIQTGAVTGLSSAFTSLVVILTLMFFTSLLYYLPQSVLASIIILAVIGLVNIKGFVHAWRAQKSDGIISVSTFILTLYFAPELDIGIMIGVGASLIWFLIRSTKPNIAMLSKHSDGTFRNRVRFGLEQCKYIAVIRYQGSLFFANESYLDRIVLDVINAMPELKHIIIVGNGINELDASGENLLSDLIDRIRNKGVDISFSGLNDHVLDTMKRTYLLERIGEDNIFRNLTRAVEKIHPKVHSDNCSENICPLREVVVCKK